MRLLVNSLGHWGYERVQISEFRPISIGCPATPYALQDRTDELSAARLPHQGDVVLKCLHRDDPLRRTYLQRRWRAT